MEGEYVMDTICDTKKSKTPRTTYVGVFLFFAGLASWFFWKYLETIDYISCGRLQQPTLSAIFNI